jgi:hypothetical protein
MTTIEELSHGFVKGRFLAGVADTADGDAAPDALPMTGKVTFTATATKLRVLSETLGPVTVFPRDIVVDLDAEGHLALNGSRTIALWATDDPDSNPTDWQWKASAALKFDGKDMSDSVTFELPAGTTVDLTTVAPVQTLSPGTVILRGPKGDPGDPGSGEGGGSDGEDGADGESPQLRVSAGKVQTKLPSEGAWTDLFTIPTPSNGSDGDDGQDGDDGAPGASVTVTTVAAASWPPAADANPLHWYVKVP